MLERHHTVNPEDLKLFHITDDTDEAIRIVMHAARGEFAEAVEAWKRVEGQSPAYLSLLADRFLNAFRKLDSESQGIALLRGYLERYPSLDLLNAVFQAVLESEGTASAQALLREELRRNPTLIGLSRLIEMQISRSARRSSARPRAHALADRAAFPRTSLLSMDSSTSARASSTGTARPATAGRPTCRAAPRSELAA